jgi:hypothetical protein
MTGEEIAMAIARQMSKEAAVGREISPRVREISEGLGLRLGRDIVASGIRYLLVDGGKGIMCLRCAAISHNPNDVEKKYCGQCHEFLGEPKETS